MNRRAADRDASEAQALDSASLAKARLMAWAAESDSRSWGAGSNLGMIAVGSAAVILGGLAVVRVLAPRRRREAPAPPADRTARRLISGALVARAGIWLLPHVIRAVQTRSKGRTPR